MRHFLLKCFIDSKSMVTVSFGQEINIQKGEALFGTACIGCHYAGGNIIQPVSISIHIFSTV